MSITLVTAYYDLTKYEKRPSDRDREHYYMWSEFVLKLNKYIVFFVGEEQDYKFIWRERKKNNLLDKTIIIIRPFEKIKFYNQLDEINEYLKETPPINISEKETNYFALITWSKIFFMEEAIKQNYFKTDYFGWIDFGIYHVLKDNIPDDIENLIIPTTPKIKILERVWTTDSEMKDYKEYAKMLRCKMGGGYWTADIDHMTQFINLFKKYLYLLLSMRLIIQEEGIFGMIYHYHSELFETYLGNYYNIFENYKKLEVYDFIILYNIEYCREQGSYKRGFELCKKLIDEIYFKIPIIDRLKIIFEMIITGYNINKNETEEYINKWINMIEEEKNTEFTKYLKEHVDQLLYNFNFFNNIYINKIYSLIK